MKDKILAFICTICPFCIAARMFPNSKYAKALSKAEEECPACKAYKKLHKPNVPVGERSEPVEPA